MSSPNAPVATVAGRRTRAALIGSGFIADVHLMVMRHLTSVEVTALVDPVLTRAESLARKYGIANVFASVEDLIAHAAVDAVHVLVPPALHGEIADRCLAAGLHVLVEKPLVLDAAAVPALAAAAARHGLVLATNHNLTHHPAVRRLQGHLAAGRLGRLEHVSIQHNVPLRQLATGDVGHFMFQTSANILWEQAVHPFSIVFALLGRCQAMQAVAAERTMLQNGVEFAAEWTLMLECERGTANVRLAFGRSMLETTLQAIGSDGAAFLDLQRTSCWVRRKTRWLEFLDHGLNLAAGAVHMMSRAIAAVAGYGLGLFKLAFPEDAFLRGMRGAIEAFHGAVRGQAALPDPMTAAAAEAVLDMCRQGARAAGVAIEPPSPPAALAAPVAPRAGEVVVLGGTGFLGRRCVRQLREAKKPVTLVVRRPELLPAELRDGSVRVFVGDAGDREVLTQACAGATAVLHLATVAGTDAAKVERTMADAVARAADVALELGIRRFVYASSTAALWLGDGAAITGETPPDARPSERGAYARGKIAAERELVARRGRGTEITIVRPAIVVGHDGIMEHSGVGLWVKDNHCVGWGTGRTALPFVLADDCAAGLVAAALAANAGDKAYNLAGDVRLTAAEFVRELAARTGRDYHFHPTRLRWMWLQEVAKYGVKLLARRPREWPCFRDLASRSFRAPLDCGDSKRDLGFAPEQARPRFLQRLFDKPGR
ncbi:MAG: Gfo/Idh/MocA family oxidoreductase [Planctomycetes bacterium]|nr:Gfo/Idh/MocA family oxidoreductase [Planctomycetota bacterium]